MSNRISYARLVGALAAMALALGGAASARTLGDGEAAITGVSPKQAMAGQLVIISGTHLDGTRAVTFGKVGSQSVRVDPNGMWVRAVVPAGVPAGSLYITLDNSGNPVSVGPFQILAGSVPAAANPAPAANAKVTGGVSAKVVRPPQIKGLSPASGPVGSKVIITGAQLGGAQWVKFGGVRGQVNSSNATTVVALVPKNAHSGKITLHTASGGTTVSGQSFRVVKRTGV